MNQQPDNSSGPDINPTTGLPLIDDTYIDTGGYPYGHIPTWQPPYNPIPDYTPTPSPNPW